MTSETVCLTREELYEQVWSEPMSKLAKKYGLSDVGLAKICRRLNVPMPGRGYWRKIEVGNSVRRPMLRRLPEGVRSDTQKVTLRRSPSTTTAAEPTGPVAEQRQYEARQENRISVAECLTDPHTLVAKTVLALRRAKSHQGYLLPKAGSALAVRVSLDSADRAMCIYDALLKALEKRGLAVSVAAGDQPSTVVRVREENVAIVVEEKIARVERRTPERGQRSQSTFFGPQCDWQPTGQLTLRIDHGSLDGVRRTWSDGKQQRVEHCLNAFIVAIVEASEALKAQRLAREAWEREWKAAQERRDEEARRREQEAARVRALEHTMAVWQTARLMREYLAAFRRSLEPAGMQDDQSMLEWVTWVEGYADRLDPLLPSPSVPSDPRRSVPMAQW